MAPCKVSDISISASGPPGIGIPGFGSPFAPIPFPLPDLDLPTDLVENLIELMNRIQALFPAGMLFKPNLDNAMKNVLDFVANIFNQIAPFLGLYRFFLSAIQMISCLLEVICSLLNPFALAQKLKKLFSECIPNFLSIFPWFALIAMILALLLLILALLEYIIETVLAVIAQIIKNIQVLTEALTLADPESQLAAAQKIASLLCFVENLLSILIAVAAIVAIIQSIAKFAGFTLCSDEDESGCCSSDICPDFIKNNKQIFVTTGVLTYLKQVKSDLSTVSGLPVSLQTQLADQLLLRQERWQLYDADTDTDTPINLIITPTESETFGSHIFFPEQDFAADTSPQRSPYTVDMTMAIDLSVFHTDEPVNTRTMVIKDCIVVRKPRNGVLTYNGDIDDLGTGTFDLEGGLVYEEDGETPFLIDGEQATLNNFIHLDAISATDTLSSDDRYVIENVEFVWKPQHGALANYNLITIGCFPEVAIEKAAINAVIQAEGLGAIADRVPALNNYSDDISAAQACATTALAKFRSNINVDTANEFQSEIVSCLSNLIDKSNELYCDTFIDGVSAFKSTFSIDTEAQFLTRPIIISVILRDAGGTEISKSIPEHCIGEITDKLTGEATFGSVSDFTYANDIFTAEITADFAGAGEIRVLFDGNVLSTFNIGGDFATPSTISEDFLPYQFIGVVTEPAVRRGDTDVSDS